MAGYCDRLGELKIFQPHLLLNLSFCVQNPPREAKVRQFNRQRNRNRATETPARVTLSHGDTKSKLSRIDENEESGGVSLGG
jgi:hypothetical protein